MKLEMVQPGRHLFAGSQSTSSFYLRIFIALLALIVPVRAGAQVLLGDQAIESSPDGSSPGMAEAFQTTAGSTGTLGSLTIYLDSSSRSRQIFVGLYTNAAGHPGTLLVQGSSSTPRAGAWNTLSISPVSVTAGTRYWIAVLGTSGTVQFRDSVGGCSSESSAQSNLASLPTKWSSGASWSTCRLSAYGSAAASSQPILSISPSSLTLAATQGGTNPAPATVNVANSGTGTLNFTTSSDATWLSASPVSGAAPQTLQISAATAGLSANTYVGHVTVTASGAQGSPAALTVTLNVSAPPLPPAPILNSLSPPSATAGGSGFTLSAIGSNFVAGDVLLWNGSALTTNFVSASQLTASVPGALIANVGTASVVVQPPSGTNSNALSFAINATPAPTIGSLSPASAIAGGPGFTLTVTGTNFVSGDQVLWNGAALATTFNSSVQLTASVAASLIASLGTASVAVQPPSGANSNTLSFAINAAPAPTIGSLSPASAIAGGPGFTLTVTGTNFVSGNQVLWNGAALATTFSSSTQLTASVAGSLISSVGTASVAVQPPSGANSNTLSFAINAAPAPTIGALSPASAIAGGPGFTLTVTGTNFVSGDQVLWNGAALATTFSSSTQLTASVAAGLIASVGTASVAVQPPSGANSNALSFAISAPPAPTIGSLSPASAVAGGPGFTLTVTGTSFVSGDAVLWNAASLTTTFTSSTQLTASVSANLIASVGTASVVVQPPAGSGSQSAITPNSNVMNFTITAPPAPVLGSLLPSSAIMGGTGFTLTLNGSNFIAGDTVLWNGSSLSTNFVSSTQLTAAIPASLIASSGSFGVSVQPPSGTASNTLSFVVTSGSPSVLLGDQNVEGVPDSNSSGSAEAFQSKAVGTGTLNSLVVYLDGASAATQLSVGLFADSGGLPGSLLSQGSSTTLRSAAWNTIPIPPINVSAGTNYWIAILGTGGTLRFRDGSGCTSASSAQTNLTTLPSNWTTGSSWPSCPLSAYGVSTGSSVPPSTYTISGTISSAANGAGSTVVLSGAANSSTSADASGNYSFTGLANGSYTVTPSKPGFSFTPAFQNVAVNGANASGVNFTATAVSTSFTISGTVSPVTNGAGATLSLNGAASNTTLADTSGNYSFSGLSNGSYTVTPSKTGFTFNPSVQPVTISSANVTAVNFTATAQPPTFSISGSITPAANGSGATVTLGGTSAATTVADSSGNYVFSGLANGSYTLTPNKTNFSFSPSTQTVSVNGANVAGANFTASSSQNFAFFDDFLAATLDPAWTALNRPGDASGSELQCNTPANVSLAAGNLLMTSQQQSISCGGTTLAYTSGAIQWTSFNFTYGTVEYRMQLPGGSGLRPVFWLLGSDCQASNIVSPDNIGGCNWPFPGSEEIDITEILGSNYNQINQGLISSAGDHGCVPNIDVSAGSGYHVYQLVWSPGSLVWKVDGNTTCSVSSSAVPSTPMFLIMETTVGGSGGTVNNTTLPQNTLVDYVKVTQP